MRRHVRRAETLREAVGGVPGPRSGLSGLPTTIDTRMSGSAPWWMVQMALPGLRIPAGSNNDLMACCRLVDDAADLRATQSRLSSPTPCSPVRVPPRLSAKAKIRSTASTRVRQAAPLARVDDEDRVQVAVAGVREHEDPGAGLVGDRMDAADRLGEPRRRHGDVLDHDPADALERRQRLSAGGEEPRALDGIVGRLDVRRQRRQHVGDDRRPRSAAACPSVCASRNAAPLARRSRALQRVDRRERRPVDDLEDDGPYARGARPRSPRRPPRRCSAKYAATVPVATGSRQAAAPWRATTTPSVPSEPTSRPSRS